MRIGTPASFGEPPQPRRPLRDGSPLAAELREIEIEAIVPNPQQPRTQFDDESLGELEHSIREFGLLQPIVVRETEAGRFQLVMGERRWRAAKRVGLQTVPAIVRQTADDAMLRDALLENIHRVQLNPLDEAAAYEQLLVEFGVTHTELADRLGRSRPVVTNTIRLLRLPVSVQRRVAAGVLSAGHARALLGLDDAGQQEELAARIVAEGMSVRATEEAVVLLRRETPDKPRAGEATADAGAGSAGSGRAAVGPLRHAREGRARPAEGPDRRRVRLGRGPGAHRRADEPLPQRLAPGRGESHERGECGRNALARR